jgi:ATP-dependent DNA helicase
VQARALGGGVILTQRRNVILSAPTNSGKSLVGLVMLLEAVSRGRRALLLEPLRALAREKGDELGRVAPSLGEILGIPFTVRVTTGDFRLDEEALADSPPGKGEFVIATPERVEAILRNPAHDHWFDSIDAICVDEAHLIADPKRGPILEYLITFALSRAVPPRIALLSATVGNVTKAQEWLRPCDVIRERNRHPPLTLEVGALEPNRNADSIVLAEATSVLSQLHNSLLVFVYQTRAAEKLARHLTEELGLLVGSSGALPYHSRLSTSDRQRVRDALAAGLCRCVVATTALGHGVNLPATHVIVRDSTFHGEGRLSTSEIVQMTGRAGRGDRPGHAMVLVRPTDDWQAENLAAALRLGELPDLESATSRSRGRGLGTANVDEIVAGRVAALLARRPDSGIEDAELRAFFASSLGGSEFASHMVQAIRWLTDPQRALAFRGEHGRYRLTALGLPLVRATFPLNAGAGVAQLIRDLLSVDQKDKVLSQWTVTDHLLLIELLRGELLERGARPMLSGSLADSVDSWVEEQPRISPILYRRWIRGSARTSNAEEILGSLGIASANSGHGPEGARLAGLKATVRAIILYERSRGTAVHSLEERWRTEVDGIEERWRDDVLWLLGGLGELYDIKCFYHHLRAECHANQDRVSRVKVELRRLRLQTFGLRDDLRYASPLGPMLRALRRSTSGQSKPRVGVGTIKRLEDAGITTVAQLSRLELADLASLGIRRDFAQQLRRHIRHRRQ